MPGNVGEFTDNTSISLIVNAVSKLSRIFYHVKQFRTVPIKIVKLPSVRSDHQNRGLTHITVVAGKHSPAEVIFREYILAW